MVTQGRLLRALARPHTRIAILAVVSFSSSLASCAAVSNPPRLDPIFQKETPLLFAHRGGAREAPESTRLAFKHAVKARADVLELDVQKTRDGKFVVWHGPKLDNVFIAGQSPNPQDRSRSEINQYLWHELDGRAWVADPGPEHCDLTKVPHDSDRELMLLKDFLAEFCLCRSECRDQGKSHGERSLRIRSHHRRRPSV